MLIHQFLENSADRFPNKTAVRDTDRSITYHLLNRQANSLAACLMSHGVKKNDRIAIIFENSIEYVVAYYAVLKAGAVASPLQPNLKPNGLRYLLGNLEPTAIITNEKSERLLKATDLSGVGLKIAVIRNPKNKWAADPFQVMDFESAASEAHSVALNQGIEDSDLASIIYTSGSTGKPKGVMLSHSNVVSNTNSICQYLELSDSDSQMTVLPFFYVMGKSLLNTHVAAGGRIIINNRFMYPADVINQMIEEKVTGFSGVPSTYAFLLNRSPLEKYKEQLSHLRYCSQAGGHMASSLKLQLKKVLPDHTKIVIMYGATEASARLTYLDPKYYLSKIDSIGKAIPDVSIKIIDRQGNEIKDEKEGELIASGKNIMLGYWKDPDSTTQAISNLGYHTGDIGYRDSEGFLYIRHRKDGLLKVGGHRVNPHETEDCLMDTELIIEAAVIGLPDNLLGKKLVAIVTPKDDTFEPDNLMRKCASVLPSHKCPSQIIALRALPKNANGKIDLEKCLEIGMKETQAI